MSPFSLHHGTRGRYDGHLGAKETCTLQHSGRGNSARILQSALVAVVGDRHLATLRVPIARDKVGRLCGQAKFEAGRVSSISSAAPPAMARITNKAV